jgi:hypothetical protein
MELTSFGGGSMINGTGLYGKNVPPLAGRR